MRKFVVLMLVLGMASLASATLQISIDGMPTPDPVDSEITIEPSQHLCLDIYTDAAIPGYASVYAAIAVLPNEGTISGGVPVHGAAGDLYGDAGYVAPLVGPWGGISNTAAVEIPAMTTLYDMIDFHCEGPDDAVIVLYETTDFVTWTPVDQVTIHQPEPMTMALLGLGGLFLRRRK